MIRESYVSAEQVRQFSFAPESRKFSEEDPKYGSYSCTETAEERVRP